MNIVVLSGMNKVLTFLPKASKLSKAAAGAGKAGKVKGLLGRIRLHPDMAADMTKLKQVMGRRRGGTMKIGPNKGIIDGVPPKSPKGSLKGKGSMDAPMTNADSKMALQKGEYQNNMMSGGPLDDINKNAAGSFNGGQYNVVKLDEDLILYRAGDSTGRNGGKMGSYFSRTPPKTRVQVRTSSAVKTEWTKNGKVTGVSKIDQVVEVRIPAGTTIFEGPIASMGGKHHGIGGNQIFIDQPWLIKGVEDNAKVIRKLSGNAAGGSLSDALHATRQDAGLTARTSKVAIRSVRAADAAMATSRRGAVGDQVGLGDKAAGQWTANQVARCTSISGKCVDITKIKNDTATQCSGGTVSGKCPGNANIKCCITGGLTPGLIL